MNKSEHGHGRFSSRRIRIVRNLQRQSINQLDFGSELIARSSQFGRARVVDVAKSRQYVVGVTTGFRVDASVRPFPIFDFVGYPTSARSQAIAPRKEVGHHQLPECLAPRFVRFGEPRDLVSRSLGALCTLVAEWSTACF